MERDLEHIRSARFVVREGSLSYGRRRRGREQKQVDVLLTVDMLTAASYGGMKIAELYAGDLDFTPVVEALNQRGVYVILHAHRHHCAKDLRNVADEYRELNFKELYGLLALETRNRHSGFEGTDQEHGYGQRMHAKSKFIVDGHEAHIRQVNQNQWVALIDGYPVENRTWAAFWGNAELLEKVLRSEFREVVPANL
jgi:hypothetical protein